MDISTQNCVECKAKVSSFLFRGVGHILYILSLLHSGTHADNKLFINLESVNED